MASRFRRVFPRLAAALLSIVIARTAGANLLVNGSFETGPDPGVAMQLDSGSSAITGWLVSQGNIDYCGTRWTAASGARSIGLNGVAPGAVAQTFSTVTHATYTVRFYMAGDPGSLPAIKQLRVSVPGQSADFEADITGMWEWDPGWNWHAWSFTAQSTSTPIEFLSLMSGDTGPSIDSVTVELSSVAGVDPAGTLALAVSAAPNPTRDGSRVEFSLPRAMSVRVAILDLAGREVAVLASGAQTAGHHQVAWDGRSEVGRAAPGVYLVELRAENRRAVRRLVVLK